MWRVGATSVARGLRNEDRTERAEAFARALSMPDGDRLGGVGCRPDGRFKGRRRIDRAGRLRWQRDESGLSNSGTKAAYLIALAVHGGNSDAA
jgi:hypothetical protein